MVPDSWSVGIEIPGLAASVGNFDSILLRRGIVVVVNPDVRVEPDSVASRYLRYCVENFAISFASAVSDELPGNRMVAGIPWTSFPSAVLKDATSEMRRCSPPIASHGIQTLYEAPKSVWLK